MGCNRASGLAARDAYRAVCARHGVRWHLAAGARVWCDIPSALRSFKGPLGGRIIWKGVALPAAEFWPGGAIPGGPATMRHAERVLQALDAALPEGSR